MPKKGEVLNSAPSPAITERKRAEKLKELEERYKELFEGIQDAVMVLGSEGKFLDCNYVTVQRLGYSRDEFRRLSPADIVHPDFHELMKDNLKRMWDGESTIMELAHRCKDGTIIPVEGNARRIEYQGKQAILVVARDITERKRAEEELRNSEERLRILFEYAPDAYYLNDLKGNFIDGNKAAEEITGYKRDELIGKSLLKLKLLSPRQIPKAVALLAKNALGLSTGPDEFILKRKDGNQVPVEIRAFPVKIKGQTLVLGIARDITEHKRMEEALRHAERDWRNSFNSLEDVMIIIDKDYNIENINDYGLALLGKSREEVIGRKCYQVVGDRETPIEDCPALLAARTKQVESVDRYEERFGKYFSIKSAPIFDEKGKIAKFIDLRRDITERKRMEHELQEKNEQLDAQNEELRSQSEELMAQQQELMEKTEEVEKANRLKSDFLANMSHELRTPLNVIIGFSELMSDEVPGKINEEQRQCLSDVLNNSKQLLSLINDILDLSKIESGKVELKLVNVALTEIIKSVTRTMMPMLAPRKQSLDIEIEEGLPPVYADEGKLRQVLLNLVNNASKFTLDGGKLRIEAVSDGDWCQVSVIDNGTGIKKDNQERIFEPFTQINVLPGEQREGTGLGLALTKQLVEMCGGKIWVKTEYGKGSQFTFTVPLATSSQPNPEEETSDEKKDTNCGR